MKKIFLVVAIAMLIGITSCKNQAAQSDNEQTDTTEVVQEPLETAEVDAMSDFINEVSMSLDSIEIQEKMIYKMTEGETDKQKILNQLSSFKKLLAEKQNRISELSKKNDILSESSKKTIQNLQKMVDFLEKQLVAKTQQIEKLEDLLTKKDAKIDEFRYSINELTNESDYLKEQNYQQDKQLNTVYYIVATKKELKESGILKSNLFSKKVNNDNIDNNLFKKADKRNLTKIEIPSKSPKLLTNNPTTSYSLEQNSDGTSTLTITDIEKFWSVSPYLIIQN